MVWCLVLLFAAVGEWGGRRAPENMNRRNVPEFLWGESTKTAVYQICFELSPSSPSPIEPMMVIIIACHRLDP